MKRNVKKSSRHRGVFGNISWILEFRELLKKSRRPLVNKGGSPNQNPSSQSPYHVLILIIEEMDNISNSHPLPLFRPPILILVRGKNKTTVCLIHYFE